MTRKLPKLSPKDYTFFSSAIAAATKVLNKTGVPVTFKAPASSIPLEILSNAKSITTTMKGSCGHTLHPSSPDSMKAISCPFCRVSTLLACLSSRTKTWHLYGGPWPEECNNEVAYQRCRENWVSYKKRLVNYMEVLESAAAKEREWEAEHPDVLESMTKKGIIVRSNADALDKARKELPLCDWVESDLDPPPKSDVTKTVRFDDAVVVIPKRKIRAFVRDAEEHQPGRWTAPSGSSYIDTSLSSDQVDQVEEEEDWEEQDWEEQGPVEEIEEGEDRVYELEEEEEGGSLSSFNGS